MKEAWICALSGKLLFSQQVIMWSQFANKISLLTKWRMFRKDDFMSQLPLDGLIKSSIAIFMVMTVNQFGYIFDTRKGIKTNMSICINSFLSWEKVSFFHFQLQVEWRGIFSKCFVCLRLRCNWHYSIGHCMASCLVTKLSKSLHWIKSYFGWNLGQILPNFTFFQLTFYL